MDGQTGLFMAAPGQGRKAGHGGTAGLKQVRDNWQGRTKKLPVLCLVNWSETKIFPFLLWRVNDYFIFNAFICRRILFNLLPSHVATHFLDNQFRSNMVSKVITLPYKNVISKIIRTHLVLHSRVCLDGVTHLYIYTFLPTQGFFLNAIINSKREKIQYYFFGSINACVLCNLDFKLYLVWQFR